MKNIYDSNEVFQKVSFLCFDSKYKRLYLNTNVWIFVLLRWLAGMVFLSLSDVTGFAYESPSNIPFKVVHKPNHRAKRAATTLKEPVEMPFYIFNNAISPPVRNFCPSGYMGDVVDIAIVGGYDNVRQQDYAPLKVCYMARGEKGWMGMMWQNPNDNWGNLDGGYNLSKATKLTFWAMGVNGDEVVEFKIGGALGNYPDSISRSTGRLRLTNAWKQYVIDLAGNDLCYVSAAFGFFCDKASNPNGCVFYLDDIKFE